MHGANWCTFQPKLEIKKKNRPQGNFLHSNSNSYNKKFLIFQETKTSKNFLYLLIFQETEAPKNFFIIQGKELSFISRSNFPSSKNKNNPLLKSFLYFGEMKSFNLKLKKFLIFKERTFRAQISKVFYTFPYKEAKFSIL